MTYANLMVNLEQRQTNAAVLRVACDFSERFRASVVGISARQLPINIYDGGGYTGPLIIDERDELEREMSDLEASFRHALHNRAAGIEWRSSVSFGSPAGYIAMQARCADLVITSTNAQGVRGVNTGDLVMEAGRPVLTVPSEHDALNADNVVLAWKDTREARRAALDALPLLKLAAMVLVVEIAAADDMADARTRTEDVVRWLQRHGIGAETIVSASGEKDSGRLRDIAREHQAGIIVAGAYGHSRVREWMLGGVARDLLFDTEFCSLLSHRLHVHRRMVAVRSNRPLLSSFRASPCPAAHSRLRYRQVGIVMSGMRSLLAFEVRASTRGASPD